MQDKLNIGRSGKAQGSLMIALENSPVLCAFGLVRSRCTVATTTKNLQGPPPRTKLERVLTAAASRRKLEGIRQTGRAALLTAPFHEEMAPFSKDSSQPTISPAIHDALTRYQAAMAANSTYGYKSMPLEWDVWVHPNKPWSLAGASIVHGSAAALVTQAVTTSMGLRGLARTAGDYQIAAGHGFSPSTWLTQFGNSINIAVNGDKDIPLPLHGPEGACWRLVIEVESVEGINPKIWRKVEVSGDVDSNDVVMPPRRTVGVAVGDDGSATWRRDAPAEEAEVVGFIPALYSKFAAADKTDLEGTGVAPQPKASVALSHRYLTFWPLPLDLAFDDVLLTVNGFTPVLNTMFGAVSTPLLARRKTMGMARLNLEELVRENPQILEGEDVKLEISLGPTQPRKVNVLRPHAAPDMSCGLDVILPDEKEGEEREEGNGIDDGSDVDEEIIMTLSEVQQLFSMRQTSLKEQKKKEKIITWWRGVGSNSINSQSSKSSQLNSGFNSKRSRILESDSASENDSDDELEVATTPIAALGCSPGDLLTNFQPLHFQEVDFKPKIRLRISMEEVPVIEAMQNLGVPRAAAQTAVIMLSQPGGLYLDIKSAYSTPYDLQLFITALRGVGINTKAVCSFKPEQLELGSIADTVLFFHGLSGLEVACDSGTIRPGQFVLFNGASFLTDFKPEAFKHMSRDVAEQSLGNVSGWPLDDMALRKYHTLTDMYGIVGGLYVQEPDASPASIDALCRLVSEHPEYFPLGFAYGGVSGRAVSWLDARGRGFASQQLVEELAAMRDLSKKALERIANGEHVGASLSTSIVLAGWLTKGDRWLSYAEQRAVCMLLAEVQSDAAVAAMVAEIGGIEMLVTKFHQYYESITPLTLLESGWNWGFTKSLLRLLRNRGVMASLTLPQKVDLATFFISPALYGFGLTYVMQLLSLRRGLHKHAKEGLVCLLESCDEQEYRRVVSSLGGKNKVELFLHGWLHISWHYNRRLHAVIKNHRRDSWSLTYCNPALEYAALPRSMYYDHARTKGSPWDFKSAAHAATHTRNKKKRELIVRFTRRSACCLFTMSYTAALELVSLLMFIPFCVVPRVVGVSFHGASKLFAVLVTGLVFAGCVAGGIIIVLRYLIDNSGFLTLPGLFYPNN